MKGWLSLKIEIRLNVESIFFRFYFQNIVRNRLQYENIVYIYRRKTPIQNCEKLALQRQHNQYAVAERRVGCKERI